MNMNTDEDFIKSFSNEELEVLEKLYKKQQELYLQQYDSLKSGADEQAMRQYSSVMNKESYLDSPVELIFIVNCVVLNKNDSGEVLSHDEILNKHYHVPLLNKEQIKSYIEGFFKKFQSAAEKQTQEILGESNE